MKVKVCGMTQVDQILQLNEWGIPFVGLIFYDKSPRYVKTAAVKSTDLTKEKLAIKKVGVFVNESEENILRIVEEWQLDWVQLHGDETPKFCEQISAHVPTIKAFRLTENEDISWKLHPYQECVDMFLFDSGGTGKNAAYGGTGEKFNWKTLENATIGKPFLLSGGIGPEDVDVVKRFSSLQQDLFALDLNSKFETSPGVKDMDKLRIFLNALNY